MHIRTDDEVYRVDAVWLGPPRATFPWRARYSAYGVGLIVMLAVMFVQRRLGIDLGFFSVAWALLITVAITRFVSRRINDERPLLEWLTLFVHELRGPRARRRVTGGALTTGHVTVRRDRPRLTGAPTAIALPRGSDRSTTPVVGPTPATDDAAWGPPPRDEEPAPAPAPEPAPEREAGREAEREADVTPEVPAEAPATVTASDHVTPEVRKDGPSHARATRRARAQRPVTRSRARGAAADFGPPSSTDVGETPAPRRAGDAETTAKPTAKPAAKPTAKSTAKPAATPTTKPAELPPAGAAPDAAMAAWTGARPARREAVPARRAASAIRKAVPEPDPDRTQRRPVRPRRRPGWPMSNAPAERSEPDAPFGPGTRSRDDRRGDPGAAPR